MKRISDSDQFTTNASAIQQTAADASKHDVSAQLSDKYLDNGELKLGWWRTFFTSYANWRERRHTMKILRGLSSCQLKDIGLSCGDVDKLYGNRNEDRKIWPNWPK
ncbi:DUF1127 domain-containing protein [Rouxiella badensis]|jgi:uncharacterized protein YjiS (DUF1127 family)|uniref:YjiS-like domain-containing protein n=1 Tax=Rouxiella badensis TaxID=1646377 RepID=A0A1X0WHW0_9GAMM|nr:DUF1127 domain-containing protein [Rouxiella badensis]MCC3703409.1 DUF1127 domain-containing protein [Rouxiella badensis]MCC3731832.1 DUF1127 domain-containing protein [Rouxiella badensis]MCC3746663.1 DUF1127 domain-containing protein [Rouxiella badensis]MCC3757221.1 DUF1127 domain-containing protein [Rouxiella badensis]ORJ26376.1 hypothetical protein BS640_05920 [Rouxiella badensis]